MVRKSLFRERFKMNLKQLQEISMETLTEFCNTTTLQGLRHTVAPNYHLIERSFWTVTFVGMSFCFVVLCLQQLDRFYTRPTVVSIDKGFRNWSITYPAVTLCPNEKTDPQLIEQYILKKWNVTKEDEKFDYYSEFLTLLAAISFRANMRSFWKFEHDPSFKNLDLMEVVAAIYRQIIIKTSSHDPKHKNIWVPIMTEIGLCWTFNSVFSKYQSIKTWAIKQKNPQSFSNDITESDLLSCNYMSKRCFARFTVINQTGAYYIHSPWEVVDSITTSSGEVEEGQEMEVEYKVSEMRTDSEVIKLSHSQRRCKYPQEAISKNIPAYSNGLCEIDCRTKISVVFCGCRPFYIVLGTTKPCDVYGMSCLGRGMEVLVNMPTNLAKCQCVPQCTEINYIPHDKRMHAWNSSENSLFDRRASIRLALQMPKIVMYKNVIFTFQDLMGSFGGVGALFLGASFMSLIEVLICLVKPFLKMYNQRKSWSPDNDNKGHS